jgi:hypothetical protein
MASHRRFVALSSATAFWAGLLPIQRQAKPTLQRKVAEIQWLLNVVSTRHV